MMATKECPLCGSAFECGGISLRNPCWCLCAETTKERRQEISRLTDECVCESCLKDNKKGL